MAIEEELLPEGALRLSLVFGPYFVVGWKKNCLQSFWEDKKDIREVPFILQLNADISQSVFTDIWGKMGNELKFQISGFVWLKHQEHCV